MSLAGGLTLLGATLQSGLNMSRPHAVTCLLMAVLCLVRSTVLDWKVTLTCCCCFCVLLLCC